MGREIVDVLMAEEPCIVHLSEAIDNLNDLDATLDNIDHNTEELEMLSKILRGRIYCEMGDMLNTLINSEDEEDEDSGDPTKEG
jgi:hypothetical protein